MKDLEEQTKKSRSLLMDSERIDHVNENKYALIGKGHYKLCFVDKSLVVLIDDDQEIAIFDKFKHGVVSYDQQMLSQ